MRGSPSGHAALGGPGDTAAPGLSLAWGSEPPSTSGGCGASLACSPAPLALPLGLHALGGPRRPGRKKTPAPLGPLSREVITAWPGPLLSYAVPALLLRALRGPVDLSSACFPPPARAPSQSAQRPGRLQVRPRTSGWASCLPAEPGGGGSRRLGQALSPRAPGSQEAGPRPLPLPCPSPTSLPQPALTSFPSFSESRSVWPARAHLALPLGRARP